MTRVTGSFPPGPIWHELRCVVERSGKPAERFTRCAHAVIRHDRRRVYIDGRCSGGGPEVELRRDHLGLDLGLRAKVVRVGPGGDDIDDVAAWFDGLTPGWRSPSSRSEAGERARAARARGVVSPGKQRPPWKRRRHSDTPPPPPPPSWGSWRARATASDLAVLGLAARPADLAALKRAWRETAKRTHPDAGGDAAEFIAARAAYERLALVVGAEAAR